MLVCGGATYYNSRNVNDANLMRSNLIETSRKMARAKKFEANWLFFGIPAVILWFGWFMYNMYTQNGDALHEGIFWGGCVGGLIGAILGIRIHVKTQRQYQEIIDTIEDITAEN
jgi:membrane associated rhomboid family serine protease